MPAAAGSNCVSAYGVEMATTRWTCLGGGSDAVFWASCSMATTLGGPPTSSREAPAIPAAGCGESSATARAPSSIAGLEPGQASLDDAIKWGTRFIGPL